MVDTEEDDGIVDREREGVCDRRFISLISKKGDAFEVSLRAGKASKLIDTVLTDECDGGGEGDDERDEHTSYAVPEIPVPAVDSIALAKVIEFCEHYVRDPMTEIEKPIRSDDMGKIVQRWYADFVDVEQSLLFEVMLAANYMDIPPLLNLTCAAVACMIKGKTPEEIRKKFNIVNDFTPEEEKQLMAENRWCEEA
jgi:S-phase kinase-associated protein 1